MSNIYGHKALEMLMREDATVELVVEEARIFNEIGEVMLSEAGLKDKLGAVMQKIKDFIKKLGDFLKKLARNIDHSLNQGAFKVTDKIKGVVGGKKMLHVKYVQANAFDVLKIDDIFKRANDMTYWAESRVKALADGNKDTDEIIKEAIEYTEQIKDINADIAKAKDSVKEYQRENMSSEFALRYIDDMTHIIKTAATMTQAMQKNSRVFDSIVKSIEVKQKMLEKEIPVNDEAYNDLGKRMSTAIDLARNAITMYNGVSILVAQFSKNFIESKIRVEAALLKAAGENAEAQHA